MYPGPDAQLVFERVKGRRWLRIGMNSMLIMIIAHVWSEYSVHYELLLSLPSDASVHRKAPLLHRMA